jgi:hypothetical protein
MLPHIGMLGQPLCYDCVPYGWEPNSTTGLPDEGRQTPHPAFNTIMERLAARSLLVDLNIRDNEASADFKRVITESWKTKFQLVPPDKHQRNKAKQMIWNFKNHFLSILAGVDAAFPPYLWDLLLP